MEAVLKLIGYLFNSVGHGCQELYQPHKLQVTQRILRLIDVQDAFGSRDGHDVAEEETFNFDFQLQKARYVLDEPSSNGDERQFSDRLPCSLALFGPWCQHAVGQACCRAEVLVKYEIEARIYNGDDCVTSASKAVRIFDCPDMHPAPVHTELFPGEYVCDIEQRLRSTFGINRPLLRISSTEPKPAEIRSDGDATIVPITLNFVISNIDEPPKHLDVRVGSILKATTFIAAGKMVGQPCVKSSKFNPFVAAIPKWGRAYSRKLHINQWTRSSDSKQTSWSASALVWMPISESATPAPSFWTPFLARRYSASLRVEVKGSAGKGLFQLCVPIQIVYPEIVDEVPTYETAMSTPASEVEGFEFGDTDELPIYVR